MNDAHYEIMYPDLPQNQFKKWMRIFMEFCRSTGWKKIIFFESLKNEQFLKT